MGFTKFGTKPMTMYTWRAACHISCYQINIPDLAAAWIAHQANTCYSHAHTHKELQQILAQYWIISFLRDYYCIYIVKWINTEVFMKWNVNIFAVSNTILHSLRIKLETCFFFNNTIFDHFKHTGSVRKHIFSSEHYFLCFFFHTNSHQGELF